MGGYSVILPKGWARAFWISFIFAGARAVGLREWNAMYYESGALVFPNDFPGTNSYTENAERIRKEEEEEHFKRPKGKRTPYLEGAEPFEAPFWRFKEALMDMKSPGVLKMANNEVTDDVMVADTWENRYDGLKLVRSRRELLQIKAAMSKADGREASVLAALGLTEASSLSSYFVNVRLMMVDRGVAHKNAIISVTEPSNDVSKVSSIILP